jgi:hypothetical protein
VDEDWDPEELDDPWDWALSPGLKSVVARKKDAAVLEEKSTLIFDSFSGV